MNVTNNGGMKIDIPMFFDGTSGIGIQVLTVSVIALLVVAFLAIAGMWITARIFEAGAKAITSRITREGDSGATRLVPKEFGQPRSEAELILLILRLYNLPDDHGEPVRSQDETRPFQDDIERIVVAVKIFRAEWDRRRR